MNLDIRSNIKKNFKGNSKKEIFDTISTALTSKDELILPGLGVLFEIVWKNGDKELQDKFIDIIHKKMNI